MSKRDDKAAGSEIRYRCIVCGEETTEPRMDQEYVLPQRCPDIFCDGPVWSILPNHEPTHGTK